MFQTQGYVDVEKMYEENETAIFKAVRQKDKTPVIIKIPNTGYQQPPVIAGFKHALE